VKKQTHAETKDLFQEHIAIQETLGSNHLSATPTYFPQEYLKVETFPHAVHNQPLSLRFCLFMEDSCKTLSFSSPDHAILRPPTAITKLESDAHTLNKMEIGHYRASKQA